MLYARQHTRTKRSKVSDPCSAEHAGQESVQGTHSYYSYYSYYCCNHYYLHPVTAHSCSPLLTTTTP